MLEHLSSFSLTILNAEVKALDSNSILASISVGHGPAQNTLALESIMITPNPSLPVASFQEAAEKIPKVPGLGRF